MPIYDYEKQIVVLNAENFAVCWFVFLSFASKIIAPFEAIYFQLVAYCSIIWIDSKMKTINPACKRMRKSLYSGMLILKFLVNKSKNFIFICWNLFFFHFFFVCMN